MPLRAGKSLIWILFNTTCIASHLTVCCSCQVSECSGGTATGIVVDNPNMKPLHRLSPTITSRSMTTEVSVATNTTPAPQAGTLFPTGATTATTALQAHFYYEHHTHHPTSTATAAVVQLSQTPQPSAAVQTDNGKRSQVWVTHSVWRNHVCWNWGSDNSVAEAASPLGDVLCGGYSFWHFRGSCGHHV